MPKAEMTSRERLLAALRGEETDRMPWAPILAYWWESRTDLHEAGQRRFLTDLRCDLLMRGHGMTCNVERRNSAVRQEKAGDETRTTIETPVGSISCLHRYFRGPNTSFMAEHYVKTKEDIKTLTYYMENTRITPNHGAVAKLIDEAGEDGLVVPILAPEFKSGFQQLIEAYIGTIQANYLLEDYPDLMEGLIAAMHENGRLAADIAADSEAEAFIYWEDSSTLNVSPAQFERYVRPELDLYGAKVRAQGKFLIHHACGHLKGLLPIMKDMEIDMIESISPPPTGDVEMWDAYRELGGREAPGMQVGLIGGIEPLHLLTLGKEDFYAYVNELLDRMAGCRRYILSNSDSCPVGVEEWKFRMVTDIVRERWG
ncbi:MAG: hypothetical protein FWE70_05310 [Oscillospiraceae bacterium]|nr:hypothetical protein [Oscillospiraceae bacterium]